MTRQRNLLPTDQADGLRRMFAAPRAVIVPVVANPHVEHHGAVLARLASVFAERGLNTLVVDAADTAPEPGELAFIDLAARGLPMQHVDTRGSCASFIPRMVNVVADVDVVVIHAEARVLARMLGEQPLRPILLASGASESLTHAYAALKLLVQRLGLMSFDLVTPSVKGRGPTPAQIARRVAECADRFLAAAMHDSATIDPTVAFGGAAGPDLMRLASAQLSIPAPVPSPSAPARSRASARAADASSSYLSA